MEQRPGWSEEPALRLPGEEKSWEKPKMGRLGVLKALGSQGP